MNLSIITRDLEEASEANLEAYEETGSAGIASDRCEDCARPLVVSSYGTWFGSPSASDVRVLHYTCTCHQGR